MSAPQPPKDYTTKIEVTTTMGEIIGMLTAHKSRRVSTLFDELGEPVGLTFTMIVGDVPTDFALPARWQAVERLLIAARQGGRDVKDVSAEQAKRVAWRQLRDWVAAQMALIEVGMVKLEEVFMPFAVFGWDEAADRPITMFQLYEDKRLALPAPKP